MRVENLRRSLLRLTIAGVACVVSPGLNTLRAQGVRVTPLDFATGSQFEDYLRVLQVAGRAPAYPWSIRGFSPQEIDSLSRADTAGVWRLAQSPRTGLSLGAFSLSSIYNSAFPYGANDGPVWAGRGLTASVSGGVAARFGPLSILVNPVAFRTSNNAFPLLQNGQSGPLAFNHGTYTGLIDLPQRFGNTAYGRLDPGASTVRLDSRYITAGVSTANQWIGPATEFPFLLGTNAAGFPHVFVGTGHPLNVGLGRIHARATWGKLYQSEYSPVTGPERFSPGLPGGTTRLASSVQAVLIPRGLPGLEVGVGRFFHIPYTADQPNARFWKKPFRLLFLKNEYAQGDTLGQDNQLASVFFRWVFPKSGFEIYGERGYEDQIYDLRELLQDIDHDREYMLGFQKVLTITPAQVDVVKAEIVNYQLTTLARLRNEGFIYTHSTLRQGHTNRGQLLGASAGAFGAAASTVSWTRYAPTGRTSVMFRRILRDQRGEYYNNGVEDPKSSDVIIALGFERMRFGRRADLGLRIEGMTNYNRNFSSDAGNLNLQLTTRLHR